MYGMVDFLGFFAGGGKGGRDPVDIGERAEILVLTAGVVGGVEGLDVIAVTGAEDGFSGLLLSDEEIFSEFFAGGGEDGLAGDNDLVEMGERAKEVMVTTGVVGGVDFLGLDVTCVEDGFSGFLITDDDDFFVDFFAEMVDLTMFFFLLITGVLHVDGGSKSSVVGTA